MSASNLITAAEFDRSLDTVTKGANLPTVFAESFRYVAFQVLTHRNLDAATRMFAAIDKAPAMPKGCTIGKFKTAVTEVTGGVVTFQKGAASMAKGANLPPFDAEMSGRFWEVEKETSTKTPEERLLAALDAYAKKNGATKAAAVVAVWEKMQAMSAALSTELGAISGDAKAE